MTFKYTQQKHQQTEQDLTMLLANLNSWLQNYQQFQTDFPHKPDCEKTCPYYQIFSQVDEAANRHQELLKTIDEIEEIPI